MDPRKAAILSRMRAPLKTSPMLSEIVDVEVGTSQAGNTQLVATIAPVENNIPVRDKALRFYLRLPNGKDGPEDLGRMRQKGYSFLTAVNTDFPRYSKRVGKDQYQLPNGEVVSFKEKATSDAAVDEAVFAALDKMAEGGTDAVADYAGRRVFMCPQTAEFDADNMRLTQFIKYIAADLRDGQDYLTNDFVDTEKQAEFLTAAGI